MVSAGHVAVRVVHRCVLKVRRLNVVKEGVLYVIVGQHRVRVRHRLVIQLLWLAFCVGVWWNVLLRRLVLK